MRASRDWAKACATGDVELIVSFWAEDAIVLPPGHAAVVGREAIREFVRPELQRCRAFRLLGSPNRRQSPIAGDLGCLIESNQTTFKDANGTLATRYGKVTTVWRKDAGGEWKCVIDIWNSNPSVRVFPSRA